MTILAGDLVLLDVQQANRDERVVGTRPELDITRSPNPHLTFGHGPHFCFGTPLARLELQVLFDTLLRRFPILTLAIPVQELRHRSGHLTGGLTALPITW